MNNHLKAILFLAVFSSCSGNSEQIKFNRYRVAGERLYEKVCANCHQPNGEGLRGLYPPLSNSDFLRNNFTESVCIIRNGAHKPLVINGTTYNMEMPPSGLSHLEIAEVVTYIYNAWGENRGLIDVKKVDSIAYICN